MARSSSLLRAGVLSMALLASFLGVEALFDPFNIFRARPESEYLDPFGDGPQKSPPPPRTEQEEKGAARPNTMGLTRVPPIGEPSKASLDTISLRVNVRDDKPDGAWTIVSENSGVSAMHIAIMRHGRAIMFDTVTTGRSLMRLRFDNCRHDPRRHRTDCWAHAVEFDYTTGAIRPLKILTDTWCSAGGFDADGNLVQSGGYFEGDRVVRYLSPCDTCDWKEHPFSLFEGRWYATQQMLPDGRFAVFGGRRAFSFEPLPRPGMFNHQSVPLALLRDTTDDVENNLYPFVNLLPDGNLFIFANDRGIIFDHRSEIVIRDIPPLPGGSRNYPASAMSAMLPLDLRGKQLQGGPELEPEVIICGGANKTAFKLGENGTYGWALKDCGRINLVKQDAQWATEEMPVQRVMGDMLILPTGDLLLLNGAAKGCAGWGFARAPVRTPLLYSPWAPQESRFRPLTESTISRVYHSTAALLPDATVLVAGGNTNSGYNFSGVDFPTEMRVERFSPPYLDRRLAANRPKIDVLSVPREGMRYGAKFTFRFWTPVEPVVEADVMVTMYAPPFTTHGYSMNQRLLILPITSFIADGRSYMITVDAPGKPELAPPGYYLVYVVAKDVPSIAAWARIMQ
ncbi:aldehyde oxidase GLOX1-like [Hordeum vulgare subsp. vulgare]|uniref:Glyoxal oxidase n=1 Tax=Hordeum vulgare subsp. vulgare TaxID=112509 RepID=A0A8I6WYZ3_HORVV|nr:aldehyde oxidase GLOX1-like [Hordeum vulgare subsp. vulgare]